jgi:hypothetical protein
LLSFALASLAPLALCWTLCQRLPRSYENSRPFALPAPAEARRRSHWILRHRKRAPLTRSRPGRPIGSKRTRKEAAQLATALEVLQNLEADLLEVRGEHEQAEAKRARLLEAADPDMDKIGALGG